MLHFKSETGDRELNPFTYPNLVSRVPGAAGSSASAKKSRRTRPAASTSNITHTAPSRRLIVYPDEDLWCVALTCACDQCARDNFDDDDPRAAYWMANRRALGLLC